MAVTAEPNRWTLLVVSRCPLRRVWWTALLQHLTQTCRYRDARFGSGTFATHRQAPGGGRAEQAAITRPIVGTDPVLTAPVVVYVLVAGPGPVGSHCNPLQRSKRLVNDRPCGECFAK